MSFPSKRHYTLVMNIAIIGGGITGLSAAYELTKKGHTVTIFEKEPFLGGLAQGFTKPDWDWHIEAAYHHLFTNDHAILHLLQELGIQDKIITKRPITATQWNQQLYPLDSAKGLLLFPGLPIIDRIRTGMLVAGLKMFPWWKLLESYTAQSFFTTFGGKAGWNAIWNPLMVGKFGTHANNIAASWLWARIKKRTPSLAYIEGGFHTLIQTLEKQIKEHGGICLTSCTITSITPPSKKKNTFTISVGKKEYVADKVLLTIPTPLAAKIVPSLPNTYLTNPLTIPHLHAQVLIIESKEPLLHNVYWVNITDRSFPFLAVVAHTNYMDKKHYGGHHLTYIGNYLPSDHPYLSYSKETLYDTFFPYIKKICPTLSPRFVPLNTYLFTAPFAQPVHERYYSQKAPSMITPIEGLFLSNMDSIYPWDRGTNYAVELGQKAAYTILTSSK